MARMRRAARLRLIAPFKNFSCNSVELRGRVDRILADKKLRALWLLAFGLFIGIAFLTRLLLEREYPTTGAELPKKILEGFISSGFVTFGLGLVVYFGTRQLREAKEEIKVVPVEEISELFADAQSRATFWYFKGGLGRYLTSKSLPEVLKNGRTGYRFRAYIVDPFNAELCKEMARARKDFTQARVRIEAFTTIVEYVRQVHDSLPSIESACCGLIDDFAPLRTDLSDVGAIVTHDHPAAPAVFYKDESLFCDGIRQELTTGPNSYRNFDVRKLAVELDGDACKPKALTIEYVQQVLAALTAELKNERPLPDEVIPGDVAAAVVECANTRESPYTPRKRRLLGKLGK